MDFILEQLQRVPRTFQCEVPTRKNYLNIRKLFLDAADNKVKKAKIDLLRNNCFSDTAICKMKSIVGSKRLDNLHDYLVRKKPNKSLLRLT